MFVSVICYSLSLCDKGETKKLRITFVSRLYPVPGQRDCEEVGEHIVHSRHSLFRRGGIRERLEVCFLQPLVQELPKATL